MNSAYRIHELIDNRSPIYGKGFQKVFKMAVDRGLEYWLEYIQTHKK